MLNDEDSAKLALSEAAKKVSDIKTRQWEISKNALVILAFLAAVFRRDPKQQFLDLPKCFEFLVLGVYFVFYCTINWQAFTNANKYKDIYRKAGLQLYSKDALNLYFQDNPANMVEDEGRLQLFLFLVVLVFFALVGYQI